MSDLKYEQVHDGKVLAAILAERKMSGRDLARLMGCSPHQVYRLLRRANWRTNELQQVGAVLKTDLFVGYAHLPFAEIEVGFIHRQNGKLCFQIGLDLSLLEKNKNGLGKA